MRLTMRQKRNPKKRLSCDSCFKPFYSVLHVILLKESLKMQAKKMAKSVVKF